jgi:hypothetical protein
MLLKAFVDRSMFLRNLPIVALQHLKRSVGEMLLGLLSITYVSQYRQPCTVIFVLKSLVCFHHYTVRQVFTYSFEFSRSLVYPLVPNSSPTCRFSLHLLFRFSTKFHCWMNSAGLVIRLAQ